MKASELKNIVGLISPCLGDSQVLPALSYLCFDSAGVYAYNDIVATRYDWEHGLKSFGVNGRSLASLLAGWGDRELELSNIKENDIERLVIKSGKAVTKLPIIPLSSFLLETPKLIGAASGTTTDSVALAETSDETATSAANPVYKSVTLAAKEGSQDLFAYSTTGSTMIHAKVGELKEPAKEDRAWIVPKLAISQILAVSKLGQTVRMQLGKQALLAKAKNSMVITKLVTEFQVPDFQKPLEGETQVTLKAGWKENIKLENALDTAAVIVNESEGSPCKFTFADGKVTIRAISKLGSEYTDSVKVDAEGEFEFFCDPNKLLSAFHFESLSPKSKCRIQEKAALFGHSDTFLYAAAFLTPNTPAKEVTEE